MNLAETMIGQPVKIIDVSSVNENVRRRLTDLGVMEGTIVSLKKLMPFGGPVTIESNRQWIALRRKEALHIKVENL